MSFVQFSTLYRNKAGDVSSDYVSLLPRKLTLNRDYVASRFFNNYDTLFKEVDVLRETDVETAEMRDLWATPHEGEIRQETQDQLFSRIYNRFKQVILETWQPGVQHAILHSSGYDSRILSWAIRDLYQEHGDDWLGKIVFLCTHHEGPRFRDIMALEGWGEDRYYVSSNQVSRCLRGFKGAWRRAGVSALPINFFWYLPELAVKAGLLTTSLEQTYNAQWGNTCLDCINGSQYRYKWKMFYLSALGTRPMYGQRIIAPFSDVELARLVYTSSVKLGDRLRPAFVKWLHPDLFAIENMSCAHDRRARVSDKLWDQVERDYRNSWYGKQIPARPDRKPSTIDFKPFWSHWTAASLCEYLRAEGYEIK